MQEDKAKVLLAQATAEFATETEKLRKIETAISDHVNLYRSQHSKRNTVSKLKMFQDYYDKIKWEYSQQQEQVELADKKRRECLAVLEQSAKERKVVEKLKEKRLVEFQKSMLAEEQKILDELGIQAFSRNN
jgi:flagellar FliJ protein